LPCRRVNIWDVGGGDRIRLLWNQYFEETNAMIFVFDSQDTCEHRQEIATEELHRLSREMAEYGLDTILIFANKQDGDRAMRMEEVKKILNPYCLQQKNWHIQPCSAKTGEGLYEGLKWLGGVL